MCLEGVEEKGGIIHQQCALHITEEHKEPSPRPRQISHMLVTTVSTFQQKMPKVRYPNSETSIKTGVFAVHTERINSSVDAKSQLPSFTCQWRISLLS